jgi:hypothetical protein
MARVKALPGVKLIRMDQCAYGSPHKKPTGILTNAPWLYELRRCETTPPHDHTILQGKVWSYKENRSVWYTSEAAEYPAAMCEHWASKWQQFVQAKQKESMNLLKMEKSGKFGNSLISTSQAPRHETKQQKSMKEVRDEENTHALGGMRNPNAAVASLKGWPQVGNTLRSVLDDVMDECPLIEEMIAKLRNKENPENCSLYMQSLAAAAEAAARKIGQHLKIEGAMQTGPSGWRWKLMRGNYSLGWRSRR